MVLSPAAGGGTDAASKNPPGLATKLCFTTVATPWGVVVDDAVIHQQVQRAGEQADQQAEARVAASADPPAPQTGSPTAALVIMMLDGWPLRQRGDDWSRKPADAVGERGAWQECKSAVNYRLQQGGEAKGLQTLHDLPAWCAQRAQPLPPTVATEANYFEKHRDHLHYAARAAEGCPVGSGARESFCAQLQGRFKRCGQFWTEPGRRRLVALEIARRNHDWHQVWQLN